MAGSVFRRIPLRHVSHNGTDKSLRCSQVRSYVEATAHALLIIAGQDFGAVDAKRVQRDDDPEGVKLWGNLTTWIVERAGIKPVGAPSVGGFRCLACRQRGRRLGPIWKK